MLAEQVSHLSSPKLGILKASFSALLFPSIFTFSTSNSSLQMPDSSLKGNVLTVAMGDQKHLGEIVRFENYWE